MKNVKTLLVGALVVGSFVACSDDDDNGGDTNQPPVDARTELYTSNHSNGNIAVFDVEEDGTISNNNSNTFITASLDSEGIFYDASADVATQASRTDLQLNSYADISLTDDGLTVSLSGSSEAVLESPRDIAVSADGNTYVVSDNADVDDDDTTADGRFFVFTRTSSGFELRNTVTVDFKVWGIEMVNGDLYAVVDTTNSVALFSDFVALNTTDTTVAATKTVAFEGIGRTHGLAFDGGTMILTDIGDAGSDTDGGFHIVSSFESKFSTATDGGMVAGAEQTRVAGAATFLGNPVSAEYDAASETIFIAELANGGGQVLTFSNTAEGDVAPTSNTSLSGVSSVYFYSDN